MAGAFAKEGEQPLDRSILLAMLAVQRQRGPDGCGLYLGRAAALGSVRLAIKDVAGGDQPFLSDSGNIVCCYNGEIYNFEALHQELSDRGCRFTSRCDGEVIANLYALDGVEGLKRLDGQFALALWDKTSATGVLARDEFGVVPLFYSARRDRFVFASTLEAFLAEPAFAGRLNNEAILDCCAFWTPIGRHSILCGVEAVLPGEILTIQGSVVTSRFRSFQLPAVEKDGTSSSADGDVRGVLAEAVRRRIPSEVPFGVYLSGGVDSAAICAFVARQHAEPTALSVTFPGSPRNEAPEQREIAHALGLRHFTFACSPVDVATYFQAAVLNAESPFMRTAPVATFLLSRLERESGIKVILSGEGADELFCGYDIYRSIPLVERLAHGASVASLLSPSQQDDWMTRDPFARASYGDGAASSAGADIAAQIAVLHPSPFGPHALRWRNGSRLAELLAPELRGRFALDARCQALLAYLPANFAQLDPLQRASLLDFNTLLAGYLLSSQGDRMAMAHSVELRVPFLDRALVRRVSQIPWTERMPGQSTKMALRQALDGLLPDAIRLRPKKAFSATDLALRDPRVWDCLGCYLSPETIRRFGLFDPAAVDPLVRKARQAGAHGNDFVSPFALIASVHMLAENVARSRSPGRGALRPNRVYVDRLNAIADVTDQEDRC